METFERGGTSQRGPWKILALQGLSARCWEACKPFLQTQFLKSEGGPEKVLESLWEVPSPWEGFGGPGRFWEVFGRACLKS